MGLPIFPSAIDFCLHFFSDTESSYITRMHSSRMRTVRSSSRLLGGGICPREGGLPKGGVCPGGCVSCIPVCNGANTPPPVDRMTDRCKNITFPKLRLRTVTAAIPITSKAGLYQLNVDVKTPYKKSISYWSVK